MAVLNGVFAVPARVTGQRSADSHEPSRCFVWRSACGLARTCRWAPNSRCSRVSQGSIIRWRSRTQGFSASCVVLSNLHLVDVRRASKARQRQSQSRGSYPRSLILRVARVNLGAVMPAPRWAIRGGKTQVGTSAMPMSEWLAITEGRPMQRCNDGPRVPCVAFDWTTGLSDLVARIRS